MYGTIQLSEVLFNSHIGSLSKAKASLAGVGKPSFNTTATSKGLDLYQEQFNELHQLVKTYATLLETDIALMAGTGKEMHRTDSVLGQNMFPGLQ
ncbi:TIGR04197 family type VII secretion effector [Streptococcus oralis]|uniref:Type VII secretion effector n=1 Tax=Streptococcus oralis subsp. oralis TaxID=1891914 RepID=A0ABD6RPP7_STROR|nr:TIGR04197 family type VII secretion effector [Streptococcus oralis]ORO75066.1 type VII secretion effector [Streptococcus oralis subsp. oralis]